ncbi:hypothetical protein MNBD_CHLOROFLEXI01-1696 [hydrothermal vent metagenome]|uniref:TolB protein, periplasmic protein involved in the tonb-independent uptake of group A colicins n=1 Tax=hydrothermal vent metagenome TaxID=652676 RepID=A0A3B0VKS4_9ZZZZ
MKTKIVYTKFLFIGLLWSILVACATVIEPTPTVSLAEAVTVSVERPSSTATPQPSKTPTLIPTVVETETAVPTNTPTATQFPTPTPIPPLVWSNNINFMAHIDGISGSTVAWSPTRNEFIATNCWNLQTNPQWQIFRFEESEFEMIPITPQDFSCALPDEIGWTPNGERILHSDTLPDDHPNKIYGEDNAIWIMNRDGSEYQPVNFDEAYGRYLVFSDWLNSEILVYKYYCGGGNDCIVKLNIITGQQLSKTIVHIGDGFQAGKDYVATNTGMYSDSNTSAVSIMDVEIHSESYFADGKYSICLSTKCGAFPCILSPCIDDNSRFEDWLPNTNKMLVVTWTADDFLLLFGDFDDQLNPEVKTQLQLWDIDSQELSLLVDEAIFGRFSPDGRFLAYQTLLPTPQMHIMDIQTRQTLHSFPTITPTLEPAIAASSSPYLWSPNSTQLIIRDPQGNLTVLTVADGSLTPLSLSGGERLKNPQWSYDGRYLSVSVQKEGGGETAVLTLITSSEES